MKLLSSNGYDHNKIYGVYVGIVTDNKDPQGQAKIKVKFPSLSNAETGHWCRLASPMAGKDRGIFFLPEVNDEVLVVFEDGDITKPYIIGTLWNGKDQPPDSNKDGKNNKSFIKSKSGNIICLDDTENSQKIEITGKNGENGIVIDISKNKLTIKSAQDIALEASNGLISLKAKKIVINSTSGTRIKAEGGLEMDGSPGNTVIKGEMVDIN